MIELELLPTKELLSMKERIENALELRAVKYIYIVFDGDENIVSAHRSRAGADEVCTGMEENDEFAEVWEIELSD